MLNYKIDTLVYLELIDFFLHRDSEITNSNNIYRLQPNANAWELMEVSMKEPRIFHEAIPLDPSVLGC